MGFVISVKSGQRRVREILFAWRSTALKTDMDRCRTRPSLLRPSGSDMHDVKESIYICWVAERFGDSHFKAVYAAFVLF